MIIIDQKSFLFFIAFIHKAKAKPNAQLSREGFKLNFFLNPSNRFGKKEFTTQIVFAVTIDLKNNIFNSAVDGNARKGPSTSERLHTTSGDLKNRPIHRANHSVA
jgi:hypothetical protein